MKLKPIVSIAVFAASSFGMTLLPLQTVLAREAKSDAQPVVEVQPTIQYDCYNLDGSIAYVTTNPQETIGWQQGCREVPYVVPEPIQSQTTYYQCYDVNGNTQFTTTNSEIAESKEASCRRIGHRDSTPVQINAAYYECLNNQGAVAFTTTRHQDTQGWIPACREIRTITNVSVPQGQP
jgi:hypothetical protein